MNHSLIETLLFLTSAFFVTVCLALGVDLVMKAIGGKLQYVLIPVGLLMWLMFLRSIKKDDY